MGDDTLQRILENLKQLRPKQQAQRYVKAEHTF